MKYARITITHVVCFIALTLAAVSLVRCLKTWPSGQMFEQLPGTQQMLMQEKTITYIDQMILQKNLII